MGTEVNAAIYYLPTEEETQAEKANLDHGTPNARTEGSEAHE